MIEIRHTVPIVNENKAVLLHLACSLKIMTNDKFVKERVKDMFFKNSTQKVHVAHCGDNSLHGRYIS